jgi:hypothetical protein
MSPRINVRSRTRANSGRAARAPGHRLTPSLAHAMQSEMRRALLLSLLVALAPAIAPAQEVGDQLIRALDLTAAAVERSFARALPLPAPSTGVSYSFDPVTGNFERDPVTLGQIYLERADPIGARRVNLSFVYQYVSLDSLEGHDADSLHSNPIPLEGLAAAVAVPTLSIGADVHEFLFAASYGITDALEASLAVPIMYSDLSVEAPVQGAAITPSGELVLVEERVSDHMHPVGVGDVLLRAKYRFAELTDVHASAGLLLRFPSGDEEALQGIGFFQVTPGLIVSTRMFQPARWARLQGHFNAGIDFDTEDVNDSDARWGFGLDWGFTDDVTAAIAFLAQNQFARVAPPGTFTFPNCRSDLVTCAADPAVRVGTQQIFGLTGARPDYYTLSLGGRGAIWRDTLFLLANVAIPLNDGFVRTAPIPLVGIEAAF